ncbi:hypothetical protein GYA27_01280 [candidate division WWE3 bacterium]|uniref:Uncharacterized protein n=1 Tax=candidate division WWE3 bacterium TaxID=2053526 RepID=A0A7X9DKE6_UNCKA|nr:hypothetical protein [candidate division WWE3 bacterium]
MKKYEVYESNAGQLILVVYGDNGKPEYIHSGYEYMPGQLSQDLKLLQEGADPAEDWENNMVDEVNVEDVEDLEDMNLVADNDGVYTEKMGIAAQIEFEEV